MALIVADRVKETTATTGTLDVVLAGASAGFQAFSGVMSSGDTCHYTVTSSNDWEVGEGTYNGGTNTLVRDIVLGSSNAGSKISLAGTSNIFITYPADRSVYKNANTQVVVGGSGIIFNDASVQTEAGLTGSGDVNELAAFDVNGEVSGVAGIETNPGGDPGLDIFREAGQTTTLVNIYTESTGVLTVIDENGYIGIGTGDPTYHLQVEGTGDFDTIRFSDGSLQTTAATGYLTSESDTLQTVVDRGSTSTTDITVSGLLTAATGVTLEQNTPATTTDKLYNVGGSLYFNGSAVDTTYTAGTGLTLGGTTFHIDDTVVQSGDNVSNLNNDAGYSTESGNVRGPVTSETNAVAKFIDTGGESITTTPVTIDAQGTMTVPSGVQMGSNNFMAFDSYTVTGVTNSSPQPIFYLGNELTGTQSSTYLFMIRLANITTNEINGASYFVRKSGTGSGSNWEAFMWGKRETAAGECPEIYIDPGPASGGAVKVRLNSANPSGGDTVLAHIMAWRVDRGDNDIQAILPESSFARYRYASNVPQLFPISSGSMDMMLTSSSSLSIRKDAVASEALDVDDKAYTQSIYNGVASPTGSPSIELDLDAANTFNITLDENKTFTIKSGTDNTGQRFLVNLRQASGVTPGSSYTVTWWSNIKWADNTEPTLSDSGNLIDTFDFHIPSGNKFFGYILGTGVYDG